MLLPQNSSCHGRIFLCDWKSFLASMAVMTLSFGWSRVFVTSQNVEDESEAKASVLHVPGSQPNRMSVLKPIKTRCKKQEGLNE
jgi:hypothetical protein